MKNGFLAGISVGLMIGIVVGFFTAHFWTWLIAGMVIAFVVFVLWRRGRTRRYKLARA